MDTTDDFHIYRLAIIGRTLKVYVDGAEVASVVLSGASTDKKILFGDLSLKEGENINAQIDYLAYSVAGARSPDGVPVEPVEEAVAEEEAAGEWTEIRRGFTIDTAGTGTDPCGTGYPIDSFDNATGATAEVKMKILEAPAAGSDGAMFSLIDGSREGKISFYDDRIYIRDSNELKKTYKMDTTDDFHIYRLAIIGRTLKVYVDGAEVASVVLSGTNPDKKILFGDLSNKEGENINAQVEYLAYSVAGALAPEVSTE